jgi:hypothetical protein
VAISTTAAGRPKCIGNLVEQRLVQIDPETVRAAVWLILLGVPATSLLGARFGVAPALFAVAAFLAAVFAALFFRWPPADWEAISAVATLAAVVTALLPIWIDAARRSHQARSLRIRLGARFVSLRPTLATFFLPPGDPRLSGLAILSPQQFQALIVELDSLMADGGVLHTDEQDHLGMTLYNLSVAALHYSSSGPIPAASAQNYIQLIDHCLDLFGRHGLVGGAVTKPW